MDRACSGYMRRQGARSPSSACSHEAMGAAGLACDEEPASPIQGLCQTMSILLVASPSNSDRLDAMQFYFANIFNSVSAPMQAPLQSQQPPVIPNGLQFQHFKMPYPIQNLWAL